MKTTTTQGCILSSVHPQNCRLLCNKRNRRTCLLMKDQIKLKGNFQQKTRLQNEKFLRWREFQIVKPEKLLHRLHLGRFFSLQDFITWNNLRQDIPVISLRQMCSYNYLSKIFDRITTYLSMS